MNERSPTLDETLGMQWWNSLPEAERTTWLARAGSAVPADAWRAFKAATREYCRRCNRELAPGTEVWLELDQRFGVYHDFGGVPEDQSQGEFAFGADCAERERAKARKAMP